MFEFQNFLKPFLLAMGLFCVPLLIWVAINLARKKKDHTHIEYWIFSNAEVLPDQNEIAEILFARNPFSKAERPLSPADGLLMSDIRLDVSLVLKDKNPHVFRPDLFSEICDPTPESLQGLANTTSIIKVRYISEPKLKNDSHLVMITHMTNAYLTVSGGCLVYDMIAEKLILAENFAAEAQLGTNPTNFDAHVQIRWLPGEGNYGYVVTAGLKKVGLKELKSDPTPNDRRVLVCEVIGKFAERIWLEGKVPETVEIEAYGDLYVVSSKSGLSITRKGPV